ncbi:DMT family transporter [Amylibacter sp. IMCC11727]|uniref:DMT family transporter n=1 Tax=Amylibacter sp. IMCC11727 TaxID=3039851 RepID=UPI00244E2563|nr:DMT family transporter [Amylibacter sp. IMCC11727]WGI22759.1 DMT family transporter [Amylibacter sp. IMCC11727]
MASAERSAAVGIFCALSATVFFSLNDLSIKFLSGDYPLHQIVFVRAAVALFITLAIIMPFDGGWAALKTRRPKIHVLRGVCVVVANSAFFAGIAAMPLADASAIFFVAPLFITGLSVIVLGEYVGFRRWIAVVVGLIGVVIVVRPTGAGFTLVALLPALAALAYAGLQTMTRYTGMSERASTMSFYIQLTFMVVTGVLALTLGDGRYAGSENEAIEFFLRPWLMPPLRDGLIMLALGGVSACAGYLISQAYRGTDAGLVAPFEYTALLLAVFWGIVIWGEWPAFTTWIGIVLIAGSGIYVALREAHLGGKPSAKRVAGRR